MVISGLQDQCVRYTIEAGAYPLIPMTQRSNARYPVLSVQLRLWTTASPRHTPKPRRTHADPLRKALLTDLLRCLSPILHPHFPRFSSL